MLVALQGDFPGRPANHASFAASAQSCSVDTRTVHKLKFEPPKMRGVAVVMLGSMLWGVSLFAAQGTQDAPAPDHERSSRR